MADAVGFDVQDPGVWGSQQDGGVGGQVEERLAVGSFVQAGAAVAVGDAEAVDFVATL
ncbi:hypothetical protein [Micromonospora sp. NPDC050276]|uniref:hypothetical protein n=1 Tax=Micromonospora sp. NPDC050276 TaxID=3364278 RepID=UPI003799C085